jgi:histidinol phosphatase-like PHP family hydrolase
MISYSFNYFLVITFKKLFIFAIDLKNKIMTTLIKVNEKSKDGQIFIDFVNHFIVKSKSVEIVKKKNKLSPYNPEFVKKIKLAEKRGQYIEINPDDVWGSLGLK